MVGAVAGAGAGIVSLFIPADGEGVKVLKLCMGAAATAGE